MKFTKGKLLETLRRKNEGWTTYQARKVAGVSVRRVNQLWVEYLQTGVIPEVGKKIGRPTNLVSDREVWIVCETYKRYRVSASTLELIIERDYGIHIPHNKVHKIMLKQGLAKPKAKKDVRKKDWIRYQRRHSLSLIHIDWYYHAETQHWIFGVIDDASRKMLALIETTSPTTEASIEGIRQAMLHGKIKQCISDHGSQFTCNREGNSQFGDFLKEQCIKQIFSKIKHPQSNGKIERWFDVYNNHRTAFQTKEEFLNWYNTIRPHRSLNFEQLETPSQAFERKKRAEVI